MRLPSKVVTAAKYVSLALGLWESFDLQPDAPPGVAAKEDGEAEAPDAP
ncbi:hypothetical protein JHJ32_12085 [Parapedobacter sp. ISTM3]|nr:MULTISPECIES: hypothetical protein [Parapedobacter]MBK1440730.1 hypothetical protein [Parapedobacter sp. ISTM3]